MPTTNFPPNLAGAADLFAARWSGRAGTLHNPVDPFAELGAALTVREALTVLAASLGVALADDNGTGLPLNVEFDLCQAIVNSRETDLHGNALKDMLPNVA